MPVLTGVALCGVLWLYLLNRSWRKDKEKLKAEGEIYPLGWRMVVCWVASHGYEASAARLSKGGAWEVLLSEGWVRVQDVMKRPRRPAVYPFHRELV